MEENEGGMAYLGWIQNRLCVRNRSYVKWKTIVLRDSVSFLQRVDSVLYENAMVGVDEKRGGEPNSCICQREALFFRCGTPQELWWSWGRFRERVRFVGEFCTGGEGRVLVATVAVQWLPYLCVMYSDGPRRNWARIII